MIIKQFYTKVAGITFDNIQEYIPNIHALDSLTAVFEPENPYDPNAIALYHKDKKIGYMPRNIAKTLSSDYDLLIKVSTITGDGDKAYGCNIFVSVDDKLKPQSRQFTQQAIIDQIFTL